MMNLSSAGIYYLYIGPTNMRKSFLITRSTTALMEKTHRGYYWLYHSPLGKGILVDYRRGRLRDGPRQLLKNFKGYLQTDGVSSRLTTSMKPDKHTVSLQKAFIVFCGD